MIQQLNVQRKSNFTKSNNLSKYDINLAYYIYRFHKGYRFRKFRIATRGLGTEHRAIRHIHYTDWPDFGIPTSTQTFLQALSVFEEEDDHLLVHCSAGLGRSGVYIAVDAALRLHRAGLHVDIPKIVTKLRQQRDGMIQTHEQYQFVCRATADALRGVIQGSQSNSSD